MNENSKLPYITQWNLSIQHTLLRSDLIEVDYTGTSGHRQQNRYDIDQCIVTASFFCDPATRPWPRYNYILYSDTNGNLNYEALILRYHHQFSKGLTVMANYTFSKTITDGWEGGGSTQSQVANCRSCDRGIVSYDIPHHFVLSNCLRTAVRSRQNFRTELAPGCRYDRRRMAGERHRHPRQRKWIDRHRPESHGE